MKSKKRKRLFLCLLTLSLMLILLSGCQLAVEGADSPAGDRLAGVFVTTEYLDLFDAEAYLNDNLRVTGGNITVEGDTAEYYDRVYAQKTPIDEWRNDYEFTELDGFGYYSLIDFGENMLDNVHYSCSDDGISDPKNHYKSTDDGESVEMDCTLYFPADGREAVFYFNPVYQTPGGDVYVTTGQGFAADTMVEGQIYSQSMEEVTTLDMNGEKESWSTKITMNIEGVLLPEKYVLVFMDEENHILRSEEYAPGSIPPEMTVAADTAYIILEAYKKNEMGQCIIEREIINRGDESFFTFSLGEKRICVKQYTYLTWN